MKLQHRKAHRHERLFRNNHKPTKYSRKRSGLKQTSNKAENAKTAINSGLHTCEHALDWLLGETLSILELLGGHGLRPADVTMDDRGPHIARAVALYPAVLCEDKSLHSLTKVLNPTKFLNSQHDNFAIM